MDNRARNGSEKTNCCRKKLCVGQLRKVNDAQKWLHTRFQDDKAAAKGRVREDCERTKTTARDHMREDRGEVGVAARVHARWGCEKGWPCERSEGRKTERRSNSAP